MILNARLSLIGVLTLAACGSEAEKQASEPSDELAVDLSQWCNQDTTQLFVSEDADCDGTATADDCDDNDAASTIISEDADCDGILSNADCDDNDPESNAKVDDPDCDSYLADEDCDNTDPSSTTIYTDADCDGYLTEEDCNDSDPTITDNSDDEDCDGVLTADDCDDTNPDLLAVVNDADCDGFLTEDDCDDANPEFNPAAHDIPFDGLDQDCDGTDSVCMYGGCDMAIALGDGHYIDVVTIPAGEDPFGEFSLSHSYSMMTTEVTQAVYAQIMDAPASTDNMLGVGPNHPVAKVNWSMAGEFANRITDIHNATYGSNFQHCYDCFSAGNSISCELIGSPYECDGYRIPTVVEFSYAFHAQQATHFWTVDGGGAVADEFTSDCNGTEVILDGGSEPLLGDYVWYCGNSNNSAQPVASRLPNGFGLYDMGGNLAEWTLDEGNVLEPLVGVDPFIVPSAPDSYRRTRGGDFRSDAHDTSTERGAITSGLNKNEEWLGFRVMRSIQ